jgi:hypothetical protein
MALQSPTTNVFSAGIALNLGTGDDAFVGQNIHVSSESSAILGAGSGHVVGVAGTVFGLGFAVWLGNDAADQSNEVKVAVSGQLVTAGDVALRMDSTGSSVLNQGLIQGIELRGSGGGSNPRVFVTNSGLIEGDGTAIRHTGTDNLAVVNTGTIRATQWALICDAA